MTFLPTPPFEAYSPVPLFLYTKGSVFPPFPYFDIGVLFYTGKQNKTKKYGLFLMFLSLIGFAIR